MKHRFAWGYADSRKLSIKRAEMPFANFSRQVAVNVCLQVLNTLIRSAMHLRVHCNSPKDGVLPKPLIPCPFQNQQPPCPPLRLIRDIVSMMKGSSTELSVWGEGEGKDGVSQCSDGGGVLFFGSEIIALILGMPTGTHEGKLNYIFLCVQTYVVFIHKSLHSSALCIAVLQAVSKTAYTRHSVRAIS